MMRTVSPGPTVPSNTWPAASCPTTLSTTGCPPSASSRSSACTAYPSMALLAKGAKSISVATSRAKGSPAALQQAISSIGVGTTWRRTTSNASSTVIMCASGLKSCAIKSLPHHIPGAATPAANRKTIEPRRRNGEGTCDAARCILIRE